MVAKAEVERYITRYRSTYGKKKETETLLNIVHTRVFSEGELDRLFRIIKRSLPMADELFNQGSEPKDALV